MKSNQQKPAWAGFNIKLALIAWFAVIGFDFFLHAGLLKDLYAQPDPFLLPLETAFAYIPFGYASFLILDIFLLWLMINLDIKGLKMGVIFGLQVGLFTWGAFSLGLFSIAAVPLKLLTGWFVGQTIELGIAGAVLGYGRVQNTLRPLFLITTGFVFLLIIASIMLQNLL